MNETRRFRQKNARDQLIVIRAAIEGSMDNLASGVIDLARAVELIKMLTDDLRALEPYVSDDPWSIY